jgi:methenyltetrahydromethanopterin cyclohydrolase
MGDGVTTAGGALRLNERAAGIADAMVATAATLRISPSTLEGGTRLIDCGIDVSGGLEAGRLLAEACLGGAGRVSFVSVDCDGLRLPGVQVLTDHPAIACLGSQYAGWAVRPEGYFAMGSGPLRAIARVEQALYESLAYAEPASGPGVLVLETRQTPGPAVAAWLAARSGVSAERLTLFVAPTASSAGGVQIAARVVETALHKLHELGFDVGRVVTGFGWAPLPPVAKNDMRAIGRANDCVLYGGTVHLTVDAEDDALEALAPRVPSSASRDYGTPFYELFKRYEWDFYKVDPHLFSPAIVSLTSTRSGRTFEAGRVNAAVLRQSLFS